MGNPKQRSARKQKRKADTADVAWATTRNVQLANSSKFTNFRTILHYPLGSLALQGSATLPINFGANAIVLSALSNYSLYTAIFDSYKIDMVEYKFTLRQAGSASNYPSVILYPDWDDSTAPTSIQQAQSHPRSVAHVLTPLKPTCTLSLVPKVAVATYNGAFNGYAQNDKPVWVDSGSPSVAHYGVKWAVYNFADPTQYIDLSIKAWVSFREPV
jgi:hypothetical protein